MHRAEDVGCWLCAVRKMAGQAWLGMPSALTPLARCDAARLQTSRARRGGALGTRPRAAPTIRPEFKQRLSCQKLVVDAGALSAARETARIARVLPASLPNT